MRSTLLTVGLALFLLGDASCTPERSRGDALRLIFITESDPGIPLAGVSVWVDREPVGTSSGGTVETIVRPVSSRQLRIAHDCPEGHWRPTKDTILRLGVFEGVRSSEAPAMEVTLRCAPKQHIAGFVVRARNGPSLPVLLNGVEVARTNSVGVAHFTRRGEPGTEYRVSLDTSSEPNLAPQHPARAFTLDDQHRVFVIDQRFRVTRPPRRRFYRGARITKIE